MTSLINRSAKISADTKILEVDTETSAGIKISEAGTEISAGIKILEAGTGTSADIKLSQAINLSIKAAIKTFHRDMELHSMGPAVLAGIRALAAGTDNRRAGKLRSDLTELNRTKESIATALAHLQDMAQRADILTKMPTNIFNARVDPNPLLFIASRD